MQIELHYVVLKLMSDSFKKKLNSKNCYIDPVKDIWHIMCIIYMCVCKCVYEIFEFKTRVVQQPRGATVAKYLIDRGRGWQVMYRFTPTVPDRVCFCEMRAHYIRRSPHQIYSVVRLGNYVLPQGTKRVLRNYCLNCILLYTYIQVPTYMFLLHLVIFTPNTFCAIRVLRYYRPKVYFFTILGIHKIE